MTAFGTGDKVVISDRGHTVTGRISEILEGEFTGLRLEGDGYNIFNARQATRYVGPLFKAGDTVELSERARRNTIFAQIWRKEFPAKVVKAVRGNPQQGYHYHLNTTDQEFDEVWLSLVVKEETVEEAVTKLKTALEGLEGGSLFAAVAGSYWELIDACKKTKNVETWRKTLRDMLDLLGDA